MRASVYYNRVVLALASFAVLALSGCDSGKPPVSASTGMSSPPEPTPTTGNNPGTTPTSPPEASTAPPDTPQPSSDASLRYTGTFRSPSCGNRSYERILTLKEDKTFTATDRVSPCPPGVQCIWSGIVVWSGTWTTDDKGVVLTKTSGGKAPTGAPTIDGPLHLALDKATMSLAEVEGGSRCVYARDAKGTQGTQGTEAR